MHIYLNSLKKKAEGKCKGVNIGCIKPGSTFSLDDASNAGKESREKKSKDSNEFPWISKHLLVAYSWIQYLANDEKRMKNKLNGKLGTEKCS